ncbi:MAG: polysaccharide deacetylase [Bacteroidetes bacterium]|nr:MAG: polysaccharide deacetylase [Bacteroidota bacterium]
MLKFRNVTLIFCLLAVLTALFFSHLFVWLFLAIAYLGYITYGASVISSGVFISARCHGNRNLKQVALTFDDGPNPENTLEVLSLLKNSGVRAAFFLIGRKIEKYPDLVFRIHQDGHLIGNHSLTHADFFPVKPAAEIRGELLETRRLIEKITGEPNLYFRPPFGVTNPIIAKALKGLDFQVTGWSIRSFDLSRQKPEIIVERILSKLKGGDVILLHDTSPQILPILNKLLINLKLRDWEVVRLDKLQGYLNKEKEKTE